MHKKFSFLTTKIDVELDANPFTEVYWGNGSIFFNEEGKFQGWEVWSERSHNFSYGDRIPSTSPASSPNRTNKTCTRLQLQQVFLWTGFSYRVALGSRHAKDCPSLF
jgi:hypothetical protein